MRKDLLVNIYVALVLGAIRLIISDVGVTIAKEMSRFWNTNVFCTFKVCVTKKCNNFRFKSTSNMYFLAKSTIPNRPSLGRTVSDIKDKYVFLCDVCWEI